MRTISTFEAKNKLSEVIALAERGEPQIITKNGKETAVVISYREFQRLTTQKIPLVDFLLDNPFRKHAIEMEFERQKDLPRPTLNFEETDDE
ncbi:MAG TPA: type II toxin-antitoxin system Phd/YefM family antitoxin [Pyrinomonadaceae bacterium]|nr:type II toxin-antitoxin system Phd/YefM family antitoxin [Pyrinomonadaceae bacterium]